MSSPGAGRFSESHWRKLYEAAVLEIDSQALQQRIYLASKAIKTRLEELVCTGENGETDRLMDALTVLEDLVKMQKAREGTPSD
jgi:hypothetical protein